MELRGDETTKKISLVDMYCIIIGETVQVN